MKSLVFKNYYLIIKLFVLAALFMPNQAMAASIYQKLSNLEFKEAEVLDAIRVISELTSINI